MNQRKFAWIIGITVVLVIVLALYVYFNKFGNAFLLSNDRAVWGQFGDYIGGILNPLLSLVNVIILIFLTLKVMNSEEDRSIRPLGAITYERDYHSFKLILYSCGSGPLMITNFKVIHENGQEYKDFNDAMKGLDFSIPGAKLFYGILEGLILPKDKEFNVVSFEVEKKPENLVKIKEAFELLNRFTIVIDYTDINKSKTLTIKNKIYFEY